ncbi:Bug family tripartite tricarboxylate transporter substrate binding protein [Pararoseomonas indoligenes]|uniref:Tripartite tricarboxylate transporter substrate binding protein n=1 Tax=Roseomonas indoligenes TaxID=2820811 RepID=A0A940MPF5_9PROT|nr:tripartite tricarboxylate transporter substrate binding protein [Pararoseomonas indoligenes]MBP0491553.1 tripartite tricarboxylate transporter substrate binding protein [Pararoseomonas indoligenes]
MVTRRAALSLSALPLIRPALAAEWPNRPVRIIVPFAAGGPADGLARMLGEVFAPKLGQPVVVENRAGAGGIIGTAAAAAATDGHTLLFGSISMTIVPHLQQSPVGYDVVRDFLPLGLVASTPFIAVVPAGSPIRNVAGLIAAAKARKGALTAANSGYGTLSHLTAELFNERTGAEIETVVYRGEGVLMPDLLGGNVGMGFLTLSSPLPHIRAGKLRALAVAGPQRLAELPDVPTFAEAGVRGMEVDGWQALLAPRSTPPEGVERVASLLAEAMADPSVRDRIATFGALPATADRAAFAREFPDEFRRWGEVVKARGLRAE